MTQSNQEMHMDGSIDTNSRQLLRDVATHFRRHPQSWTQNAGARDKNGQVISFRSQYAVSRCIDGELCHRASSTKVYEEARRLLRDHLRLEWISHWNDHSDRKIDDIITACEKAALS